ncbi:MAG: DUF58 domain-containing protein [Chloroflexota bacterium]
MPTDSPLLLDNTIRRKLEPLALVARKVRAGAIKGERRSTRRGTSIEFADYRNYVAGDDLRRLDWNVYARTERPYIKLLEDEEDLAVHVLLDASTSMAWPEADDAPPEINKLLYARRLMAGLAYISLGTNDRVLLTALRGTETVTFGPARGRAQSVGMLRYAHGLTAAGVTDLNASLRDYALRARRPGLCFLISDMFSPSGYIDGINALLGKGFEVVVLHVLSPDEVTPPMAGDLRLVDVETGAAQEVSLDASMRDLYIRRVAAWRDEVRAVLAGRGVSYLPLVTDEPFERVLLYDLRRLGVVK